MITLILFCYFKVWSDLPPEPLRAQPSPVSYQRMPFQRYGPGRRK